MLKSEESLETISGFVERRVDEFLSKRVSDVVDDKTFGRFIDFIEERIRAAVDAPAFEAKIRDFIGGRVDDLAGTETPLGLMFTPDAIDLLKEKANEQIEPVVHRSDRTCSGRKNAQSDRRSDQARSA